MNFIKNMKTIEDDNLFELLILINIKIMNHNTTFKNWFLGVLSHKLGKILLSIWRKVNKVENINFQLRDKIFYLVRMTKAHEN